MTQSDVEIRNESDYQAAVRALGERSRPSWLLRLLMNALERYRQNRKMGWSRRQNKDGLMVFAAYELHSTEDADTITAAFDTAHSEFRGELSDADRAFLSDLRADSGLMAFLFVHDRTDGERRFEGMTYSLGRRAASEPRFRDRFDVIVESEIIDGVSRGISQVRTYVDPFRRPIDLTKAAALCHERLLARESSRLFERAVELHRDWSPRTEKRWKHWTSDYIDYFGPRVTAISGTFFPTHIDVLGSLRQAV